jgi:hypothetical protein
VLAETVATLRLRLVAPPVLLTPVVLHSLQVAVVLQEAEWLCPAGMVPLAAVDV